jgi:hypothetical protein
MNTETMNQIPQVGDGATIAYFSDRRACTIVAVSKSGKKVTVQFDTALRSDERGMSDAQEYCYYRNPEGTLREFSLRSNGRWVMVGNPAKNGTSLYIGQRLEYYDYSF